MRSQTLPGDESEVNAAAPVPNMRVIYLLSSEVL